MSEDDDLLDDPKRILRLIDKALLEEVVVEVQINEKTRVFYTTFMDHPPQPDTEEEEVLDLAEAQEEDGDEEKKTADYRPRSYLFEQNHILIEPLVPAIGNALIRTSHEVLIRFFQGVKAVEGRTLFMGVLEVDGEPAISISFPKSMGVLRKRRHYRAKVISELNMWVTVRVGNTPPLKTRVIDISVGGLAFCNPLGDKPFPVNERASIQIEATELKTPIQVAGFIRNHTRASRKDGCAKDEGRCGVQFDVLSEQMAMQVEELVAFVQREHLQMINEQRGGSGKKPVPQADTREKEKEPGGLSQFFGLKKKYRFNK